MRKDPKILTNKIPIGIELRMTTFSWVEIKYLRIAPIAPPVAMAINEIIIRILRDF